MPARVGVVGHGRWGAHIVRDLLALGAAVVVADHGDDARTAAGAAGAEHTVASTGHLPECDGYVVATPASAHRVVCEELLVRGAPVYVEKPPCASIDDARALLSGRDELLFVMHKWRHHPGVLALVALGRRGDLGELRALDTVRTGPETLPPDVDVIWHLGSHDLSIALEVLGAVPSVRDVHATVGADGRVQRCVARLARPSGLEHRLEVEAGARTRTRRVTLRGTTGTAVLEHPDTDHLVVHRDGQTEHLPFVPALPLELELRTFLDHLGGGPRPVSSATDARAVVDGLAALGAATAGNT